MAHQRTSDAQEGAFNTEHMLAYAFAVAALILGLIGVLRGFGILGNDGAADAGAAGTQDIGFPAIWDSVVWLLPAITAALLAWAFHRPEHHRARDPERVTDADEAGWKGEHLGAYILALVAAVTAVLGMLTGFNVFGRDFGDQPDGIPWLLASVGSAILANALHSVGHHQLSRERQVVARRREDGGTVTRTEVDAGTRR
jgi:hypothetical protein